MAVKFKSRFLAVMAGTAISLSSLISAFPVGAYIAEDSERNYAKLLQNSLYFYDANKCGIGVSDGCLSWRGDCHTSDAEVSLNNGTNMSSSFISSNKASLDPDGDGKLDLSGGFHDAGDHVKFGLPQGYTASTLGWSYNEFKSSFDATETTDHMLDILKWFNDYFMRCTFMDGNGNVIAFCYQVGEGGSDHSYWGPPEIQPTARPAYFAYSGNPAGDQVAQAAASLAINYMNFKDVNQEYADKCLKYAKALYNFAKQYPAAGTDGTGGFYSSSGSDDDISWAAVWLYSATNDSSYLNAVGDKDHYWIHCWDNVWMGVRTKMAQLGRISWSTCKADVDRYLDSRTSGGYACATEWGSARYNTSLQMNALIYAKYNNDSSEQAKAKAQMDYLLGDNPLNRCYIVGYSSISAKFPHHRAAAGTGDANDSSPHKYVLYGALVGGPNNNDGHVDSTNEYVLNEVAIDYNCTLVGAAAALYEVYGGSIYVGDELPKVVFNAFDNDTDEVNFGDIHIDGIVDAKDIVLLARYTAKMDELSAQQILNADVLYDGNVDGKDLVKLSQYIAKTPGVVLGQ